MARIDREKRDINALGFRDGTECVSPESTTAEIAAVFDRQEHLVRHDAVDAAKGLEATVVHLTSQEPKVTAHWQALSAETRGHAPELAMPIVASGAAALAVIGETLLLAPVMDGFGIADPSWQALAAGTLVVVASGLLHLALGRVQDSLRREGTVTLEPQGRPVGAMATIALAIFALATISVLGWWRAGEMIFAGHAQGADWAEFLQQHGLLTKVCVTLLTLGLPFFAAAAFEWGFARVRYALEWRKARRNYIRVTRDLEEARKSLEAVIEKRDHLINTLQQRKIEWTQAYLEEHELGQRVGARQLPLWHVVMQIVGALLLVTALCAGIECFVQSPFTNNRLLLYVCLTLGLGTVFGYFAFKAWERPTPRQLYVQRAVVFRHINAPLGPSPAPVPAASLPNRTVASPAWEASRT